MTGERGLANGLNPLMEAIYDCAFTGATPVMFKRDPALSVQKVPPLDVQTMRTLCVMGFHLFVDQGLRSKEALERVVSLARDEFGEGHSLRPKTPATLRKWIEDATGGERNEHGMYRDAYERYCLSMNTALPVIGFAIEGPRSEEYIRALFRTHAQDISDPKSENLQPPS